MSATAADLPAATRLAVDRTRLAHDRTLLAWVRTAASLISFGFSIYKFFQLKDGSFPDPHGVIGPREFGTLMIVFGIVGLTSATVDHYRQMTQLRAEYGKAVVPRSQPTILAGFVAIVGVLAFVAVVFRQ